MKKGRHRRFEEARALKHTTTDLAAVFGGLGPDEPCAECGGIYGVNQASWCPGAPECESAVRVLEAQAALEADAASEADDDDEDDDDFEDELEDELEDDDDLAEQPAET